MCDITISFFHSNFPPRIHSLLDFSYYFTKEMFTRDIHRKKIYRREGREGGGCELRIPMLIHLFVSKVETDCLPALLSQSGIFTIAACVHIWEILPVSSCWWLNLIFFLLINSLIFYLIYFFFQSEDSLSAS